MKNDDELLETIHADEDLADLLAEVCEFDVSRAKHDEPERLSSGKALESVAGDFSGGTFFRCGPPGSTRPVLYASSEGQAGIIAGSLAEAVETMAGLPAWRDCLAYSADGDLAAMRSAAEKLARDEREKWPDVAEKRVELLRALAVTPPPVPELLARLRDAVAGTAPDFVLVDEAGEEYGTLFGEWSLDRKPL